MRNLRREWDTPIKVSKETISVNTNPKCTDLCTELVPIYFSRKIQSNPSSQSRD